jgi:hypothetical protein
MSAFLRKDTFRQEPRSLVIVDYSRIGRSWQNQGIGKSVLLSYELADKPDLVRRRYW